MKRCCWCWWCSDTVIRTSIFSRYQYKNERVHTYMHSTGPTLNLVWLTWYIIPGTSINIYQVRGSFPYTVPGQERIAATVAWHDSFFVCCCHQPATNTRRIFVFFFSGLCPPPPHSPLLGNMKKYRTLCVILFRLYSEPFESGLGCTLCSAYLGCGGARYRLPS